MGKALTRHAAVAVRVALAACLAAPLAVPAAAQVLPPHAEDPFATPATDDPVLKLGQVTAPLDQLRGVVAATIDRAPTTDEAEASRDEAAAARAEARAVDRPSVDVSISSYRVLGRRFGSSAENIIERARPGHRTDFLVNAEQLLLDHGGANARIDAAEARLRGAEAEIDSQEDRVALETIGAWYDVFTFRSLVALSAAFADSQRDLRAMIAERIKRGASAEGDLARVDSYIASADTRLARFRRQQAQAEARFEALTGSPAPANLARAPYPGGLAMSRDLAVVKATDVPAVREAREVAEAARRDAKAARSDTWPTLSAGLDAGRYGIYETPRDYDVRASLTLRQRFFGGVDARADQARARARAAGARADRAGEDAARDAEIAWSDVQALEDQLTALQTTYLASRRSRDVVAERFRLASGTLIDVLGAEDSYFETAASYVQALTELDAARYVLLSRTGTLLRALNLDTAKDIRR